MNKILVSACLLGKPVRYNGAGATFIHPILQQWQKEERLVSVCPEILSGLSVPREPVIFKDKKIIDETGNDLTDIFLLGAKKVLDICEQHKIKMAIMKARSPSCGSKQIYTDFSFKDLLDGQGIISALLIKQGCKVFNEEHLEEAYDYFNNF